MFQSRALGREETLLRYSADGSTNLVDHPDQWYAVRPRYLDECWKVSSLNVVLAAPDLLKHFRGFGGPGGSLEFGLDLYDGFGSVRNLAPIVFQSIETPKEW